METYNLFGASETMGSEGSGNMLTRGAILLSVKPRYAQSILDGIKKYEFRKVRVRDDVDGMLLYAFSPRKELVGYAEIEAVLSDSPRKLWSITGVYGGIIQWLRGLYTKAMKPINPPAGGDAVKSGLTLQFNYVPFAF